MDRRYSAEFQLIREMYDSTRLESFNNPKSSHCMSEYLAYSRVLEFLESVEFLDTLELKNPQNPYIILE